MNGFSKRVWIGLLCIPVLFSCATYQRKLSAYYQQVDAGHYERADALLSNNNFLQRDRNQLLYFMEKGKLFHLRGLYDSSNLYFNKADELIEEKRKSAGDVLLGASVNPMLQNYLGEDHERFLLHYYKALNYMQLGNTEGARVEARRIQLSEDALNDKTRKENKYQQSAFALILQGLIYEVAGEVNNAFISYRNAVDLYLKNGGNYYGVSLPEQLKHDLIRTAKASGFPDQAEIYTQSTKPGADSVKKPAGGWLVLFIETGAAPIKQEIRFSITQGVDGFYFIGTDGIRQQIFIDANTFNSDRLSQIRNTTVAIPYYQPRSVNSPVLQISANGNTYRAEDVENMNVLCARLMQERMGKEIANALIRQLVKKLTEKGSEAAATAAAQKGDTKKDGTRKSAAEKRQDAQNAEAIGAAVGLLVNIINSATEKADTRNWQSLPAFIQYVRIPLQNGTNTISLAAGNQQRTITVEGRGGIQLQNWIVRGR
jgi:hypothetical protein